MKSVEVKPGIRARYRWPNGHISHGTVTDVNDFDVRLLTDNGAIVWAPLEELEAPSALGQRVYFVIQRSALKDVTGQPIWINAKGEWRNEQKARDGYESMATKEDTFKYRLIRRTVIDEEVED